MVNGYNKKDDRYINEKQAAITQENRHRKIVCKIFIKETWCWIALLNKCASGIQFSQGKNTCAIYGINKTTDIEKIVL